MPIFGFRQTESITIKDTHELTVVVHRGFFRDRVELYVGDISIVDQHVELGYLEGHVSFELDGRTLDLQWILNPVNHQVMYVLIMHNEDVLVRFG